jgi:hypothetical protein
MGHLENCGSSFNTKFNLYMINTWTGNNAMDRKTLLLITYLLQFFSSGQAQSAVWSATTELGDGIVVYSDGTFNISLQKTVWLQSGITAGVHIGGTWYVAGANTTVAPLGCATLNNTDCRGSDLYYFNATGPDECCANCSATPTCGAWTWTGITRTDEKSAPPPPWADRCYIKSDCSGRTNYDGHISSIAPAPQGTLKLVSQAPADGADARLGPFSGYEFNYVAADPASTRLTTGFRYFTNAQLFTFYQRFPSGANRLNLSVLTNGTCESGFRSRQGQSSGFGSEFCSSQQPSSLFPTFTLASTAPDSSGAYLTWAGRFSPASYGAGLGAGLADTAGSEGGPLVLFTYTSDRTAATHSLVLSTFDNFKSNILGRPGPNGIAPAGAAFGIGGYVTSVPAGYMTSAALYFSAAGPTDAMLGWGALMQQAYATNKMTNDVIINSLSYWTDNGAYYDWYSYSNITSRGLPETVLVELAQSFLPTGPYNVEIPVHAYQLDAYWYPFVRPDANCKLSDTVWSYIFPHGLPWLQQQLGAPLLIYNGPTCEAFDWPNGVRHISSISYNVGYAMISALSIGNISQRPLQVGRWSHLQRPP